MTVGAPPLPSPTDAPPRRTSWRTTRVGRVALIVVGCLAVGLAFIGAFLPLLPTAPFVLVAGACFAGAWPRADRWLHDHAVFGPFRRMRRGRASMTRRYKWVAIGIVCLSFGATIAMTPIPTWGRITLLIVGVGIVAFLWRQPTLDPTT